MSRRWYRHEGRLIFVGWDRPLQSFFLNVVDLCRRCGGTGEESDSGDPCAACEGEGIEMGLATSSSRNPAMTLDEITAELSGLKIPFPEYVRADLELDQRTDAANVVHDYDQDPRAT
jgi:hypothetical protein